MGNIKRLSSLQKFVRFTKWLLADFYIILFAFLLAYSARLLAIPILPRESLLFIFFAVFVYILVLYLHRTYRIYWQRASGHNISILLTSSVWSGLILSLVDLFIEPRPVPLSVLGVAMILAFGGIVVIRYRSRLIGAIEWRWKAIWKQEFPISENERVLIVGAGESGHSTAVRLKHGFPDANYYIAAFVDDDPAKQDMFIEGAPVLGFTKDIAEIVKRENIDLIVVAIHKIAGSKLRQILKNCESTTARVKLVPDMLKIFDTKVSRSFLRDVQAEDIIGRSVVSRNEAVDLCAVSKRVVLVTGAAGSIGSELARQMLQYHQPSKLIILDNNESGLYDLQQELLLKYKDFKIETALVDITQADAIKAVFMQHKPSLVFHAAAYKHVPMLEEFPNEAIRVNIGGTVKLAEAAIFHKVGRFVLISTDKAVNPSSVMGASKRICELIIHALGEQKTHKTHKTLFAAVRFGNVLGSRGSVVPLFEKQIDNGGPLTVTDKRMTRYFMSISEAVNLVIHAAALTKGNDIFVLKMGEVVKIDELAQRMIRLRGLRPHVDIEIEYTGVRPGEKLHETLNDAFEHLADTIHPSILKLSDWNINGKSLDFMSDIYQLVQKGIPEDNQALSTLRSLCNLGDELGKTGD
jgi:FlaA1/EpsC-like NDP-sugar epimerase